MDSKLVFCIECGQDVVPIPVKVGKGKKTIISPVCPLCRVEMFIPTDDYEKDEKKFINRLICKCGNSTHFRVVVGGSYDVVKRDPISSYSNKTYMVNEVKFQYIPTAVCMVCTNVIEFADEPLFSSLTEEE